MGDRRSLNDSSLSSDIVTYDDEFGRRRSMGRAEYDAMMREKRNRPPSPPRRRRSRSRSRSRDRGNGGDDRDRYASKDRINRSRSPRALQSYNDNSRPVRHTGPHSPASNPARRLSNQDTRSTSGYGTTTRSFREAPRVTHTTTPEAPSRPAPSLSGSQAGSGRWNPYSAYGTYSKPKTNDAYTSHPSAPVAAAVHASSASLSSHSRPSNQNRESEYHTQREVAHTSNEGSIATSQSAVPSSSTPTYTPPDTIKMDHLLSNGSSVTPYSSYDDYVSWSSPEADDRVPVTKLSDRHTSTGATVSSTSHTTTHTTADTSTGAATDTAIGTEAQITSSQGISADKQSQGSQDTSTDVGSQHSDSKQEQRKEKRKQPGSSDDVKVWRANILVVVKSVLHRYLDAKDITREDFKMAAKEATEKILTKQQAKGKAGKHLTETDVHRIESFTEDYVKYIRKKRKASQ